ncbi:hypothetical protein Rsub_05931 [Raphidocelis subcapitata]|uniref:SRCR domain-containing protein n=1 Tax=Raphidocelis subcapitata TaxID=307507 RepID=A0A2V0P0U1_9CHLO|nr:hypothetical protein Rsub_05931 [Raphidocelis subcapitata]|eukprot:GBF93199.1 hypothetical protein Rsub_05931 [Raphidocelis subcapitata]
MARLRLSVALVLALFAAATLAQTAPAPAPLGSRWWSPWRSRGAGDAAAPAPADAAADAPATALVPEAAAAAPGAAEAVEAAPTSEAAPVALDASAPAPDSAAGDAAPAEAVPVDAEAAAASDAEAEAAAAAAAAEALAQADAAPAPAAEQPAAEQPAAAQQPAAEQPEAEQAAAKQPAPAQQPAAQQPAAAAPAAALLPEAAAARSQRSSSDERWSAMVGRLKQMEARCRAITAEWQCVETGSQICEWAEGEAGKEGKCVVPDVFVKARLIEAAPCAGSFMEQWFNCQSANNNKAECTSKAGCSWTPWSNYTSLPLPTRKLLAAAANEGACQLSKVFEMRTQSKWDDLSTLTFQISHLDPAVWGTCDTARELSSLVPLASRSNCSASFSEATCRLGAPLCRWAPVPDAQGRPAPGEKAWPTAACGVSCETPDKAACQRYTECIWKDAASACARATPEQRAARVAAAAEAAKPKPPTGIAARVRVTCGEGLGGNPADVSCMADSVMDDAALSLIKVTRDAEPTPAPANSPAATPRPHNGAAAPAGMAAATLVAAAAVAALL